MPVVLEMKVDPTKIGRQRVVADRESTMIEYARNKRVLNLGCCGSDILTTTGAIHHKEISSVSSFCFGVDIFEEGIEKLKSEGQHVALANAEELQLDVRDFEVALLGEIIEHVSNPGKLLDSAHRHLVKGGKVVVSTPNPFAVTTMLQVLLRNYYFTNNEHVAWYDPVMLEFMLNRAGFKVEEVWWTDPSDRFLLRWLQKYRWNLHSTFGMVAVKI